MSETPTPETDAVIKYVGDGPYIAYLVHFARKLERERDEAKVELKRLKKELVSANRGAEINAKVNQSLAKKLHDLEGYAARNRDRLQACSTMHLETMNERDEARRELAEFRKNSLALVEELKKSVIRLAKERDEARRECSEAQDGWSRALDERDDARRERDEALQRLSVWHGAVSQMKQQLSFAPPFHQGTDSQEEAK